MKVRFSVLAGSRGPMAIYLVAALAVVTVLTMQQSGLAQVARSGGGATIARGGPAAKAPGRAFIGGRPRKGFPRSPLSNMGGGGLLGNQLFTGFGGGLGGFGGGFGAFGGGLGGFGGGLGGFGGYGFGGLNRLHALGNIPIPPYFALHPPVYYGQRVRRSYGLSPFAAFPGVESYARPRPQMIVNSHCPQTSAPMQTAASAPRRGELILNKFVPLTAETRIAVNTNPGKIIANPFYKPADTKLASNEGESRPVQ